MDSIPAFDYTRLLPEIEDDILGGVRRVLHSGRLILGPETEAFEAEFTEAIGANHCVGVTSGTTALHLALMALGVATGDEVILPTNTCAPTAAAVRLSGANPVFVDIQDRDLQMDAAQVANAISPRTRCIIVVHLWGLAADIGTVLATANAAKIPVIEDCAQAMGTRINGQHVGTFGSLGCFSFYPTKNLGAFGDAGAVVTNNPRLADAVRTRRMYGYDDHAVSQVDGQNGRISEIQAAILRLRLQHFTPSLARRIDIANAYRTGIREDKLRHLEPGADTAPSFHQFVVRCRDRSSVQHRLTSKNIGWGVHYPTPLHAMPAFAPYVPVGTTFPIAEAAADEILSLPLFDGLTADETQRVIETLNES